MPSSSSVLLVVLLLLLLITVPCAFCSKDDGPSTRRRHGHAAQPQPQRRHVACTVHDVALTHDRPESPTDSPLSSLSPPVSHGVCGTRADHTAAAWSHAWSTAGTARRRDAAGPVAVRVWLVADPSYTAALGGDAATRTRLHDVFAVVHTLFAAPQTEVNTTLLAPPLDLEQSMTTVWVDAADVPVRPGPGGPAQ